MRFCICGILVLALLSVLIARAGGGSVGPSPREVVVPILMYHRIQDLRGEDALTLRQAVHPDDFAAQMRFLADRHYNAISPEQLADALDGTAELPDNPVLITFDDGWVCGFSTALPILKQHNLQATFFVYPDALAGTHNGRFMSWDQLSAVSAAGMTIASHTISHPHLPALSDSEARREIVESKRVLEARLGVGVSALAYPYGERTALHEQIAKDAGYRLAVGVEPGITHGRVRRLSLCRIPVVWGENLDEFAATLRGQDVPGVTSGPGRALPRPERVSSVANSTVKPPPVPALPSQQ